MARSYLPCKGGCARHYIDGATQNVAAELTKLGGARVVLATAPNAQAMTAVIDGLGVDGQLIVIGASAEPIEVTPIQLITNRRSVSGWPSGTAIDSEDTLAFSVQSGVRPMVEIVPLERAAEAFDRMISGAARFRMVLTTG